MKGRLLFLVFLTACPGVAHAAEGFPDIRLSGIVDFRAAATDDTASWLDGGLGKLRYGGGKDGDGRVIARLAQADLVARARLNWSLEAVLQLQYDKDQRRPVDIIEAYLAYDRAPTSPFSLRGRVGAFYPPVSLENRGVAWTSVYGITPSAINTWVGEELRTVGGEATMEYSTPDNRFSLTGALYEYNDTAGTLLSWRGWALHDRQTPLFDRIDMPPGLAAFSPTSLFGRQVARAEPFMEIDNRPGYYLDARWQALDYGELRVMHYDNRGRVPGHASGQYDWETKFEAAGLRLFLPGRMEFLSQGMTGSTRMEIGFGRPEYVDADFRSAYALLSKAFGANQRVSVRADIFSVDDEDQSGVDDNSEKGHAVAVDYMTTIGDHHHIGLEILRVSSDRPERATIGLAPKATELLFQAQYRFQF
jgi:hypothetical protein